MQQCEHHEANLLHKQVTTLLYSAHPAGVSLPSVQIRWTAMLNAMQRSCLGVATLCHTASAQYTYVVCTLNHVLIKIYAEEVSHQLAARPVAFCCLAIPLNQ